jgi:hypothetical protein
MTLFESTLRYAATGDKDPVLNQYSKYDSLIVRSHLLAGERDHVLGPLRKRISTHNIDFYIEPMVWDFRRGTNFRTESDTLKEWHRAYAAVLGDPLLTLVESQDHVAAAQVSAAERRQIAEAVIRFQEQALADRRNMTLDTFDDTIDAPDLRPTAVIPWIHQLGEAGDISPFMKIIRHSAQATELSLKPCLFVTPDFIRHPSQRSTVIDRLRDEGITEVFLWVDDLDKRQTTEQTYTNVIEFVYELHTASIQPHMFSGDYFSHLLAFFGLGGTTYGTNFGVANKEQLRAAGGGGGDRYYVDEARDFVKPKAAVEIQQTANTSICSCDGCAPAFSTWTDLSDRQDSDHSLRPLLQQHFLSMKEQQAHQIATERLDDLLAALEATYDDYEDAYSQSVMKGTSKRPDHLLTWKAVIEEKKDLAVQEVSTITT